MIRQNAIEEPIGPPPIILPTNDIDSLDFPPPAYGELYPSQHNGLSNQFADTSLSSLVKIKYKDCNNKNRNSNSSSSVHSKDRNSNSSSSNTSSKSTRSTPSQRREMRYAQKNSQSATSLEMIQIEEHSESRERIIEGSQTNDTKHCCSKKVFVCILFITVINLFLIVWLVVH